MIKTYDVIFPMLNGTRTIDSRNAHIVIKYVETTTGLTATWDTENCIITFGFRR